jgi:Domain of unknown function (DUF932)
MKQGRTIVELAQELERQAKERRDFVGDTRRMQLATEEAGQSTRPVLVLDNAGEDGGVGTFPLNEHAHGQLAARIKIPKPYYDRMRHEAPELLTTNVNHWFRENPEKRLVRTLDGRVRAYLSNRYRRLDHFDLAEFILPVLAETGATDIVSCEVTDLRMYLKATFPTIEAEVRPGDIVRSGVVVSNSEVGAGALSVVPMFDRLICSNGAIVTEYAQQRIHTGKRITESEELLEIFSDEALAADDHALFLKVRDLVKACATDVQFEQIVASLRETTERPITEPVGTVEELANRFSLTEGERQGVLKNLIIEGDLTQWGAVNAVTRFSQEVESYDRATELETIGGRVAALDAREWEKVAA